MNVDNLHRKLIAAARAHSPSDAVPHAFERRIVAQIKSLATTDYWAFWARALWRAAAPCVVLALVLAAWSFLSGPANTTNGDISQDFENTVLAAAAMDQAPADSSR